MMFFCRIFFAGMALSGCCRAFGQSAGDSVRHIEEVVVSGNRYRETIPSQRLSGRQLETLSAFSVADAIRYFSGVQIKDYGGVGGLKTVDVRSMGTHHTGVFYDGIQLGNAQNGQVDLGKFSMDNVEEISLYNGQKSEILQPARDFASSGAIYLRTRRPNFPGSKKTNVKALFRTGSFGLADPSLLVERKVTGRTSASLSAEYIRASGKYRFRYRKVLRDGSMAWDTTAVRQNGDIHSARVEGGLNGYLPQGKWHAKAYFYSSEKGIPGAIVNNVWKRSQRQWDRNFFVQGSFGKQLSGRLEMLANAKYALDGMRYLNPDTTLMYIDNRFWQRELYVSLAGKYALLPCLDVSLSSDYQRNSLEATLQDFAYPRRSSVLVALAAAFERKRLKAQGSLLGTFVSERTGRRGSPSPSGKPADLRKFTPAVFVSFRPFAGKRQLSPLYLRAFYKRIFRMPTFNDLYYTDIGNISLRPEQTVQYNAGVQYALEREKGVVAGVDFQADAYFNRVTDKIIAVPKGNGQYRWMMMNIGSVEIRGVDVSGKINWRLPAHFTVASGVKYTFQRAQDFSNPSDNAPQSGSYGGQIAYIPRHNGSVIAGVRRKSWELNYSFIYVGERYHNSSNIPANREQPWYTHDLTAGRELKFGKVKGKISAEINNALNQYYDVVLNYPMPGRNCKLTLKIEL
ncbi:MAG: TonB-dependent receptor [Bacteroidales bacterium]|jgi:outer membrane cobalamin receptor|nr:TonB-dependent receptor [Bacteroidales bacterium]